MAWVRPARLVGVWLLVLGARPLEDPAGLAILAVPVTPALILVGLLTRTRLPGWVVALALVPAFLLSLLAPLWALSLASGTAPISPGAHLLVVYVSTAWAVTSMLICGAITALRHLAPRKKPVPEAARRPPCGDGHPTKGEPCPSSTTAP